MKPTFEKTVDVLVKAYLNDTLKHGNCLMCAVGNIVGGTYWSDIFMTVSAGWKGSSYLNLSKDFVQHIESEDEALRTRLLNETGYRWEQLAEVEWAFESASKGNSGDEWMFNGLMAVVDVLADIHGIDLTVKEEAKLLFVKL